MAGFLLFVLGCWCLISTVLLKGLMSEKLDKDDEKAEFLFMVIWSISVMGFIFAWKAVMG